MKNKTNTENVPDQQKKKKNWVEPIWIGKDEDKNSPTRHSETKTFTDKHIKHKW